MLSCSLPVPWKTAHAQPEAVSRYTRCSLDLTYYTSPRTNITTSTNRTPNGCSYYYYSTKLRAISNNYQAAGYRQAGNRQQTTGSIPPSQGITRDRASLLCAMGFDTLYKQAVCHQRDEVSLAKLSISSRTDPCSFRLN